MPQAQSPRQPRMGEQDHRERISKWRVESGETISGQQMEASVDGPEITLNRATEGKTQSSERVLKAKKLPLQTKKGRCSVRISEDSLFSDSD